MSREQLFSAIRHLLSAVGGYLLLKGLDGSFIEQGSGIVLGIIALVWSFKDKTATSSAVGGVLRQIATFVGGIFIAKGKLDPAELDTYLGILTALIPLLLAKLDRNSTTPPTTPIV